jgi:hypothetical protein
MHIPSPERTYWVSSSEGLKEWTEETKQALKDIYRVSGIVDSNGGVGADGRLG